MNKKSKITKFPWSNFKIFSLLKKVNIYLMTNTSTLRDTLMDRFIQVPANKNKIMSRISNRMKVKILPSSTKLNQWQAQGFWIRRKWWCKLSEGKNLDNNSKKSSKKTSKKEKSNLLDKHMKISWCSAEPTITTRKLTKTILQMTWCQTDQLTRVKKFRSF